MSDQEDSPPDSNTLDSQKRSSDNSDNTIATDDIYEEKTMLIVEQLIDRGVAHMDESTPAIVHQPSGWVFESSENLAHFHKGWQAAREQYSGDSN